MTGQIDTPEAAIHKVKGATSAGDMAAAAQAEVKAFHDQYKNDPSAYNDAIKQFKNGLSDNSFALHSVELFDSAATAGDAVKTEPFTGSATRGDNIAELDQLSKNNDELYKILDTYKDKHGQGQLDGDGSNADGKIGKADLQAFMDDSKDPNSAAAKYLANNPNAGDLVNKMLTRANAADSGAAFSRGALLNELGYSGEDAWKNYQAEHSAIVINPGQNGKPDTVVTADGTSRGLHYDQSGNIDAINKTLPNGDSQQFTMNAQGKWVDANGNPAGFAAPFVDANGNYGYYTPDASDPNKYKKSTIDTKTGAVSEEGVDLTDPSVAIAGLNRTNNFAAGAQGRIGTLDVTGVPGTVSGETSDPNATHAEYKIVSGNNLTQIGRALLGVPDGQPDPANLQNVIQRLAQINGYENPNLIPADAQLKVPADILAVQAPQDAPQPPQGVQSDAPPAQGLVGGAMAQPADGGAGALDAGPQGTQPADGGAGALDGPQGPQPAGPQLPQPDGTD